MNRLKLLFAIVLISSASASAQNFTNGFNFNLPWDDSTTVDFLPAFPKIPIGENDFISTDNSGNFIKNGQAIRFFGGNLTTEGAFPLKSDAEKIAARMRKMGVNLIRFHHIDNPWSQGSLFYGINGTRQFNSTMLDRLDYLIYQLKQNGIYVNMNLNVSRTFEKADGVYAADSLQDYGKGITLFNRYVIELEKEYARDLLAHVNPYTGMSLAEDPVLAMVEIVNENSLYRRWYGDNLKPISEGGSLPTKYALELDSLWHNFLVQKYVNTEKLRNEWDKAKVTGEIIYQDNFENGLNKNQWQLEQHENARASFELFTNPVTSNKSVLVKAIEHGTASWHITFKNVGQSAQKDSIYELHFKARANDRLKLSAGFQRNNAPYTFYMGANFTVDTVFQSYKVTFKAPENNSGNLRMWFRFDDNVGDFYIDEVIFKKASTEGLLEKESIEDQNVKRLQLHEINGFTEQRVMDLTEFYANVQIGFLSEMQEFLKDSLGVKAPLAGTNWYVGPEDVYVQNTLDYLDNHAYWDHPNFPNQPWSSTDWTINNSPMMKSPSTTIERLFNGLTVKNKPYTISEYNHGYPNQFQAEMLPMITSYLSFNGADGIMFFTYSGSWDWRADKLDGYFDLHRNHAVMAGFPVFSYVYRNHLIKESGSSVVVNFNKKDVLKMPLEAENGWSTHSPFPNELSYTNKVELTFNEDEPSGLDKLPPVSPGPFILNDGQITWDKKGIFKINTPFFNCISGQLNQNKGTATEQMILESASDFGSIAWLSLVDSALSESSKSLLFIGSKQINTGMIWDGTTTVHNNWGRNPSLIAPNLISVKLKNKSAGLKLTPLDTRGNPVESKTKYFVCDESGYSKILLNPGVDKTVWYAVETVTDWSITQNRRTEIENQIMCFPNPSNNTVTIKLVFPPGKTFDLIVHDSTGKQVKSEQNQNEFECTKSELGSGMYFFRAIVDNKVYTGNFVLQP